MRTFIVCYNRNGNKKIAIKLKEKMEVIRMSNSLSKFVNDLCTQNDYTFTFHNLNDSDILLKNIPIISIGDGLCVTV